MAELLITLVIVISATLGVLRLGAVARRWRFRASDLDYVNAQFKYQMLLLGVALAVATAALALNARNFSAFVAPGDIAAPAGEAAWLGIAAGESWLQVGASLSIFITLATLAFVYLPLRKSGMSVRLVAPYLPWVLLFSLTNAFSEEAIYRLGVIIPLFGAVDTTYVLVISAVLFGAPHLRGMPNGIVGALMAGVLGWILAKSVVESHGVFWAWSIHFLQDVVIFSAVVMVAANKARQPAAPDGVAA